MKRTCWLVLIVAAAFGWGVAAYGQSQAIDLPVNQTTSYKGEEFLLIGDAVRGAGEPTIAINPKNPNNIIVSGMANLHYVEGHPLGAGRQQENFHNVSGTSISIYAISNDRGRTWRYIEDQFRENDNMHTTADAFTGVGADGTMFIGAMSFFPVNATPEMLKLESYSGFQYGLADIAWSTDEGKTWSKPVRVMGHDNKLEEYGPGVFRNGLMGTGTYDRPFLSTDLSTGAIYVGGDSTGQDPSPRQHFVRASRDNGKTWGLIYAYASRDWPQGGSASKPRAANGVLGIAYVASSVPNAAGKCPCLVFGASRDDGKSFERHVVKYDVPMARGMGNPQLAADPSHPGRFAVMSLTPDSTEMQVFVTDDYGGTWKGPVRAGAVTGATMSKPDMDYSPRGQLAVKWRAVAPDQTYTCWSAVSHDGGGEFSRAVQVSGAPSPARSSIKDRGNNRDGDDLDTLAVDNDYVHIVWMDGRTGFMGAWYARIPLASY